MVQNFLGIDFSKIWMLLNPLANTNFSDRLPGSIFSSKWGFQLISFEGLENCDLPAMIIKRFRFSKPEIVKSYNALIKSSGVKVPKCYIDNRTFSRTKHHSINIYCNLQKNLFLVWKKQKSSQIKNRLQSDTKIN